MPLRKNSLMSRPWVKVGHTSLSRLYCMNSMPNDTERTISFRTQKYENYSEVNTMQYVILANFVILITLGIRHLYLGYRLDSYMKEKHPDILEEFRRHRFMGTLKMDRWLHKDEDTGDSELTRLKAKTKNAPNAAASAMLLTVLFWILYLVIQVVRAGR